MSFKGFWLRGAHSYGFVQSQKSREQLYNKFYESLLLVLGKGKNVQIRGIKKPLPNLNPRVKDSVRLRQ